MSFGTSLLYIESLIIFQHVLFAEENLPTIALECHFQIVFRGKKILEKLSRTRFFPAFEISRSFLRAKQVGKKGGKLQNPEKIVVLKIVLIYFSL